MILQENLNVIVSSMAQFKTMKNLAVLVTGITDLL